MMGAWPELKGKTVLDIGAGQGESSREIAATMIAAGGGRLIINDIDDRHFEALRQALAHPLLELEFLRSAATKLAGIRPAAVDLIVCEDALGGIEAIQGQAVLALARWLQVLKPGGQVLIEEDLPIYMAANPAQRLWAEQKALLQAAQVLSGQKPARAFQPEILVELLELLGYADVDYEDDLASLATQAWLPAFDERMQSLIQTMDTPGQAFFTQALEALRGKAEEAGCFERPGYQVWATKPWRME